MSAPGAGAGLEDWLSWQEALHPASIELGLDRVRRVHERLAIGRPAPTVVTVAGTNGKGSSIAMLESILCAAGLRVGSYTSPHLVDYEERVRIDRRPVEASALCRAFAAVEAARDGVALTYFEFGTLAALILLAEAGLDCALLEIGLGGRLDAVNVVDPDLVLITAIGLDHRDWLGPDRETIAAEKAAVIRPGGLAVCSDPAPPAAVLRLAAERGARLLAPGRGFTIEPLARDWRWAPADGGAMQLPYPALPGRHQLDNAGGVVALCRLFAELPAGRRIDDASIAAGLRTARIRGRTEVHILPGGVELVLDVAHNPDSARALAGVLSERPCRGTSHGVIGLLADKDAESVVDELVAVIDRWYCASLAGDRGRVSVGLADVVGRRLPGVRPFRYEGGPAEAVAAALASAQSGDRIVVTGSFRTVSEVIGAFDDRVPGRARQVLMGYNPRP